MAETDLEDHVKRLFSYGFRPLFLCTCLSALILVIWWVGVWRNLLPAPTGSLPLVYWHAHEMLFGFVGSAVGGFLLTAVANWTGRAPIQGWWLGMLVVCWIVARLAIAVDPGLSQLQAIALDVSYWLLLTGLMAREVLLARNYRNLKIVVILFLFTLLNLSFHFFPEHAIRATTLLVTILISIIGGRIIPAFTGNWLRRQKGPDTGMPASFNRFDQAVIAVTVLLAVSWTLLPREPVTGGLSLVAGIAHLLRLARWKGHLTFSDPLVLVLHAGYAWLGIGFMLLGLAITTQSFPTSAGVHGLAVGGMAGLILAVSSRAAFGHSNRPLIAGKLLSAAFVLINLAALARVLATMIQPDLLDLSAFLWLAAFLAFMFRIGPVLVGKSAP